MIVYTENYGADADGNRGRMITEYEIEDSDYEAIYDQLQAYIEDMDEDENIPSSMTITLICPYSEDDIELEIDPKDYL